MKPSSSSYTTVTACLAADEPLAFDNSDDPGPADLVHDETDFIFHATAGRCFGHADPIRREYVLEDRGFGAAPADPDAMAVGYRPAQPDLRAATDPGSTLALPVAASAPGMPEAAPVSATDTTQSSLVRLTSNQSASKSTIAGYVSAIKIVISADQRMSRSGRNVFRTETQKRALQAAVEAQIALDNAKLITGIKTATANIASTRIRFTRAIHTAKIRSKATGAGMSHFEMPRRNTEAEAMTATY